MSPISFEEFCADDRLIAEPISPAWAGVFKTFDGGAWHQLCAVKGRRAGGTRTSLKYLIYKAHTSEFRRYARPGERLFVPIILQDRNIARETMSTLAGFYRNSRVLGAEVAGMYRSQIALKNGIVYAVVTCSYRAPRGVPAPLGLCDEIGVWRQQGTDIDREVIRSLTPAMVQFPNRKLILMGTPWVRAGVLFERWERRLEDDDCLVAHAPTALMNPLIPAEELERERQADPQNYAREFEGTWLNELEQFLNEADLNASIVGDRTETAPQPNVQYAMAIDASGLTRGGDRFTCVGGHALSEARVAVDFVRGWRGEPVVRVIDEITALCEMYRVPQILADQYSFTFIAELFRQRAIEVRQLAFSARSKPDIFLCMKTAFAQGRVEMVRHKEALRELRILESTRLSGGGYRICAPKGRHDDYACALAILIHELAEQPPNEPWVETLSLGPSGDWDEDRFFARRF